MSRVPLRWVAGDRCLARGRRGHVIAITGDHATVRVGPAVLITVHVDELELVPVRS